MDLQEVVDWQDAIVADATDYRRPAILPAAISADLLAEHLAPSFGRLSPLDVVSRKEAQAAIHHLDRLFVIEVQRYAFFREDPLVDDDLSPSFLNQEQADRILSVFSTGTVTLMQSLYEMTDNALAWSLSHGQKPIAWEEGRASERKIVVQERGGKLPVAYLSHAFCLGTARLERMLQKSAGIPADLAAAATAEISASVVIEIIRAGSNAGERLETLASWCLRVVELDGILLSRFILRGAYFFLHALLAAASGRPEAEIRDICFDQNTEVLEKICRDIGLADGYGQFIIRALQASKNFGPVASAEDLADFSWKMANWISAAADEADVPDEIIDLAIGTSDHLDWLEQPLPEPAEKEEAGPVAEIISLERFRRISS